MNNAFGILKAQRVIPIVRTQTREEAYTIVRALDRAGFHLIELTMTTPDVLPLIKQCRHEFPHLTIGVGTLRTVDQARQAIDVGASLLITYKASEDVADIGTQKGVPYILGAATPTEVDHCLELGSGIVKWFPASLTGPQILRDLHGPMPEAEFFPTGGITVATMGHWFKAGAIAVGIGGDLTRGGGNLGATVEEQARKALQLAAYPEIFPHEPQGG